MEDRRVSEKYSITDSPALYQKLSNEISENGVNVERVPENIHLEALECSLEEKGFPLNSYQLDRYDDWFIMDQFHIEDIDSYSDAYLQAVGKIDHRLTGRTPHERAVDALIQDHLQGREIEDYSIVLKDAFFEDQGYRSDAVRPELEDVNLPYHREHLNRVSSDIDFLGIDPDRGLLAGIEVKRSDEPFDILEGEKVKRENRQRADFLENIKYAGRNSSIDLEVQHAKKYVSDINAVNPLPNYYEGMMHFGADYSEERVAEAVNLLDEFLYEQGFRGAEPLTVELTTSEIASTR